MTEYNDIKDLIIFDDILLGKISLDVILNSIQYFIDEEKKFEDTVYTILKNTNMTNKDISSLFNLSTLDAIEMYIKIIKDEL